MKKCIWILSVILLFISCAPRVMISHSPIIAKSDELVIFTAELKDDGGRPTKVDILVNAAEVKSCPNLRSGDLCVYTGGPFSAYNRTTVSYLTKARNGWGKTDTRGYYYFAVTDNSYNWSLNYMPARRAGATGDKLNLVFHRANDYASVDDFIDDIEDKVYDIYKQQKIVREIDNFDTFNFYVYSKIASTSSCGTVDSDADTDMPWRNVDAVLHTATFGDCTNLGLTHFTAEGHNTKAFLHESGHGVFGLADEYCGFTAYFEPANEPNIFDTEATCRAEQTAKGRNPDNCWEFCSGWWGIHQLTDGNVMQIGNVGNPWGTEAEEHVNWHFDQF